MQRLQDQPAATRPRFLDCRIVLFERRKRLKELEEAEAAGRSLWTNQLDEQARWKLLYAVQRFAEDLGGYHSFDLISFAHRATVADLGLKELFDGSGGRHEDALNAILNAKGGVVFSILEALIKTAVLGVDAGMQWSEAELIHSRLPSFVDTIKTVLREHRVSFDLVKTEFIPFESREMHEAIVVPTLTLLGGRKDLEGVEAAYRTALDEIHTGSPEDAITDAGTALQEALTALGCDGNALGPLAKSAPATGVIRAHDQKLIEWVSADRSVQGDAHNAQAASAEDAWLAVHIVGALILRITDGPLRMT